MENIKDPINRGQGYQTAMSRRGISAPMKKALEIYGSIEGKRCLDFGSGRGYDAKALGIESYDPNWGPLELPEGEFDVVFSHYVLNVVPPEKWEGVVEEIMSKVKPGGVALISVRRDIKKNTPTQWVVNLPLPVAYETSSTFCVYKVVKA